MSSLARDLVSKGHGEITTFVDTAANADWTSCDIITPASGKKICILHMVVTPLNTTTISDCGFGAVGNTAPTTNVLVDFKSPAVATSLVMDLSGGPLIGGIDQTFKTKVDNASHTATYSIQYVEL